MPLLKRSAKYKLTANSAITINWNIMKKTFELTHPKIKLERRVDSVKHEVKKYLKRERNKKLPEDFDFWDFDCKFGNTQSEAKVIHLSEINKLIDQTQKEELTSFYIEVIAKPAIRQVKTEEFNAEEFSSEEE